MNRYHNSNFPLSRKCLLCLSAVWRNGSEIHYTGVNIYVTWAIKCLVV